MYLFKHVPKLCFIQWDHVNQDGLHVHGELKMGDIYVFVAHLSQVIKDFCDGSTKAWTHSVSNHGKT